MGPVFPLAYRRVLGCFSQRIGANVYPSSKENAGVESSDFPTGVFPLAYRRILGCFSQRMGANIHPSSKENAGVESSDFPTGEYRGVSPGCQCLPQLKGE